MTTSPNKSDWLFESAALREGLGRRTVRGGAVTVGSQAAQLILQFGSTMVLARLLTPDDFGLVAMASVFLAFLGSFRDAGLAIATVQQQHITHHQISTLFWFNAGLSISLGMVMVAIAPFVSWFYGRPELYGIMVVLGIVLGFEGLSIQHAALLRRHMRFGVLAAIQIGARTVGVIASIAMALLGFGYWAIVAWQVAALPLNTVGIWLVSGWVPSLPRRGTGARRMLRFGGFLAGGNILSHIGRKVDDLLIGWKLGATALGLYSKAYQLLMLPLIQINTPLTQVMLPALSRLGNDPERFRRAYQRSVSIVFLFSIGAVGLNFGAADSIIRVMLGDQWKEAVAAYRALIGLAYVSALNGRGWVVVVTGQTHKMWVSSILGICVIVPSIYFALPFGIVGVGISLSISSIVLCVVTTVYFYHNTPLEMRDFLSCIWRQTVSAAFAAALCYGIEYYCTELLASYVILLLQIAVFCSAYTLTLLALPGGSIMLHDAVSQLSHLAPEGWVTRLSDFKTRALRGFR